MRKLIFSILALLPLCLHAQDEGTRPFVFAVYSQQAVLNAMPDYASVKEAQSALKAQYDAEAQRMATEFNNKYEEFIEVQRTLAPSILNKRQAELQELAERGESFKKEARQQLQQAEQEAMQPVMQRLNDTLQTIGAERGYAFIINTDGNALSYVDPNKGENITEPLIKLLSTL
jgi:outer membrane protein